LSRANLIGQAAPVTRQLKMDSEELLAKKILAEVYEVLTEAGKSDIDSYAAQKEWELVGRVLLASALRSGIKVSPGLVKDAILA